MITSNFKIIISSQFQTYFNVYESISILRRNAKNVIDKDSIEKITIINPHGPGEDMETLMMDPITNQLYVLTKNHEEAIAYIYKVKLNSLVIISKALLRYYRPSIIRYMKCIFLQF